LLNVLDPYIPDDFITSFAACGPSAVRAGSSPLIAPRWADTRSKSATKSFRSWWREYSPTGLLVPLVG